MWSAELFTQHAKRSGEWIHLQGRQLCPESICLSLGVGRLLLKERGDALSVNNSTSFKVIHIMVLFSIVKCLGSQVIRVPNFR